MQATSQPSVRTTASGPYWRLRQNSPQSAMAKRLRIWLGILVLGFLSLFLLVLFPSLPDPICAALLVRSVTNLAIPLPPNCVRARDLASDDMTRYLDRERESERLVFKDWITCKEIPPPQGFAFWDDPHWLPSYVPGKYQFRRTVIIVPYSHSAPKGSHVMGEVCRMPWWRYLQQVAGQCDGKYSVWR